MTWRSITDDEAKLCRQMVQWMQVARQWRYGVNWLPSQADISKSALFERIRSGKEPLEYPPPVAMSCPWYALVEDHGPHFVGSDAIFNETRVSRLDKFYGVDVVWVMQHGYEIVEDRGERDFIVKDIAHDTPYRFRCWHDEDCDLVAHHYITTIRPGFRPIGGWFIQNAVFETTRCRPAAHA